MTQVRDERLAGQLSELERAQMPQRTSYWAGFMRDLAESFERWQLWWLLGYNDVRQRYRRSRVGQLWITISMGIFVIAIGPVYALLFNTELKEFLPYLTVNIVVWGFISSMINDACTAFIQSDGYIRQERLPKIGFLYRILVRNLLILGHNALLIPLVFIAFGKPVDPVALLAIPGLIIVTVNCLLMALFLATICSRFRDFPQIVSNVVQVAFFLTPIFWQKKQILADYHFVVDFNPFASLLSVVSSPILGKVPTMFEYGMCLVMTLVVGLVAVPFFARYRARIVYWL
jgi:lipopolysaccharide transport system permease protein